jgi:hypothetical protein
MQMMARLPLASPEFPLLQRHVETYIIPEDSHETQEKNTLCR